MNRTASAGYNEERDPLWYKDAIIYELHVKTFFDSDGDGIGDFKGLIQKLDYLQDLGVTAIWLLPFYPSPLRDDGYDIGDYSNVHTNYGSLRDFRVLLREAHKRGLRVITELVINHTSDQHEWFQRARRAAPGDPYRDFYVWSDTPDKYREARTIFKDFEPSNWTWDPVAQAYFWHRFYSHQPDLNFASPRVRRAIFRALEFWLRMGVDGFRLDAVPYLFEREGTSCENLPETHEFLKELRAHVEQRFPGRMLLAEANQWPEDAVAYFGDGDECNMAFHFPLMPRLFMAVRMEDRYPVVDILRETPDIPDESQWALFLRNHDELTLEMVTDEDRDYMYRTYAQDAEARINLGIRRRLAPLLGNHRRKMELMTALLLSLPGTPVIYYGDEIGMGDNIYLGDRDGVRTPMQWTSDRNAGFSTANPQRLYLPTIIDQEYHYETVNVEGQLQNPHSLLWWTKRLIALRKKHPAFGRGSIQFLYPENAKVLAFVRRYEDECLLVVVNLSRFVQGVKLDLSELQGLIPKELFGGAEFPAITDDPYFLSLGPHSFYWFELNAQPAEVLASLTKPEGELPLIKNLATWQDCLKGRPKANLEALLPEYIKSKRWFGGKARKLQAVEIAESLPLDIGDEPAASITLLDVSYVEGENEVYVLPIAFEVGERAEQVLRDSPGIVIARVSLRDGRTGVLFDAMWDEDACSALLSVIAGRRSIKGGSGTMLASTTQAFRSLNRGSTDLRPNLLSGEQSNTSVTYGDRFILKLFRRPDEGVNPDLEIGRLLTEQAKLPHSAPVAGFIEFRRGRGQPRTLAILHGLVANEGDAWTYTLDELSRYYERVMTLSPDLKEAPIEGGSLTEMAALDEERRPVPIDQAADLSSASSLRSAETIGAYLESARLLGRRTAELHLALSAPTSDQAFTPEPFTPFYQRSLLQSTRSQTRQVFATLRRQIGRLPEAVADLAKEVLAMEEAVNAHFQSVLSTNIAAMRIRCHGDFHLGQVLYTGNNFVIIDFEGEPARPLSERRVKRSPLRDVAGMLRSFHYAAYAGLERLGDLLTEEAIEPWAQFWQEQTSAAFLAAYFEHASAGDFLPPDFDDRDALLNLYLLDKAIYELGYELNNRPDWVQIPLLGIRQLMSSPDA